jgi:hypothetical protein
MADDFVGGSYTFAGDEISSKVYARIKLIHGADGVNAGDVALANPLPTTPIGIATNGLTIHRSIDLDESEEEVKATAGVVYGMWVCNLATTTRYIKFYNAAAADVTVGTTTPVITIPIPGNSADDVSGAFNVGGMGIGFGTAICIAATTGLADNDTGAPSAGDVVANVFFK